MILMVRSNSFTKPVARRQKDDPPTVRLLPPHQDLLLLRQVVRHPDAGGGHRARIHPGVLKSLVSHSPQLGLVGGEEVSEVLATSSQTSQTHIVEHQLLKDEEEGVICEISQACGW